MQVYMLCTWSAFAAISGAVSTWLRFGSIHICTCQAVKPVLSAVLCCVIAASAAFHPHQDVWCGRSWLGCTKRRQGNACRCACKHPHRRVHNVVPGRGSEKSSARRQTADSTLTSMPVKLTFTSMPVGFTGMLVKALYAVSLLADLFSELLHRLLQLLAYKVASKQFRYRFAPFP